MDAAAFAAELDGLFDGLLADGVPADPRFAEVADAVPGFCTPAEMAVLNLAARRLPAGEAYLEVGTFKGRSLTGTLLDAPDRAYVAVENFQEFGMHAALSRAELQAVLDRLGRPVTLHEGNCFAVLAKPDDWVHVACSWYHDIVPAKALGVKRVWLDREGTGEDPSAASFRVTSAQDVAAAIARLA